MIDTSEASHTVSVLATVAAVAWNFAVWRLRAIRLPYCDNLCARFPVISRDVPAGRRIHLIR
jgi:hypothetical protein